MNPETGSRIPPETKLFRAAILPLFIWTFGLGTIWLLGRVFFLDGDARDWRAFGVGAMAGAVTAFVCSVVLARYFPAAFTAEGIYGHSFWGVRRFIAWPDIREARTFRMLNLRWLRLYSRADGAVTWVAMFQSRKAEFRDEIRKLAPPQSPVLNHLNNL